MAAISASLVKDLREKTGAGMMDCKNALTEVAGDIEAAVDWLRKKGLSKAAKKSGRVAAEGLVAVAVRGNDGVVVEVNSETDFVARNEDFQKLVRSIIGFHIDVHRLEGKWKLNQNHPRERREKVVRVLEKSGDPDAREIARLMSETLR